MQEQTYKTWESETDFEQPQGKHLAGDSPVGRKESAQPAGEPARKKNRIRDWMDGTILIRENRVKQLPFVFFLTVLGFIYIGNRFHSERMIRKITELKTEVDNLRSEQITTTSELMNLSRPSRVAALVESKNLGLRESVEPPRKLTK